MVSVDEPVDVRRRIRRFGLWLTLIVVALALFAVVYVKFVFGHLRDPNHPPTVTSTPSPRVVEFELVLAAVLVVAATIVFAWRRRRSR